MLKMIRIIVLIIAGMFLLTGFVTNATAPPINNVTGSVTNTTASIDYVIESDHSYANYFDYTWPEISQPGATQMRLHFDKLDLKYRDYLSFFDKDGKKLVYYTDTNGKDFWTEWFAVNAIKLNLRTNEDETGYGFKIDKIETRTDMAPPSVLPESYHSYANYFDYTWPEISQPGATQMRLHFDKLDLKYRDYLSFFDKDGKKLVYYTDTNGKDFWTEWFAVNAIKLNLRTNGDETGYGFRIDKVETRPNTGSTPIVQPGFTSTEANGTSSPITTQPTNVTTGGNNITSAPLNTNTSEANYTAPSQNNSSYDLYGNTTPEKPTVSFYNNVTINNVSTETDNSGANNTIPAQNNPSYGLCGNSICEGPTVSFYANVTSGTAPLKVLFTSSTTGNPNSYFWVFEPTYSSDWNSKHAVTALHTFKNPGVYTVSLTVTNAAGSTTFTKYNYITVF